MSRHADLVALGIPRRGWVTSGAGFLLPCGTPVTISYNGQTLTMPVIDRGPYSDGTTVDLTRAAAQMAHERAISELETVSHEK